ncbi:MAG: hypothetical protein M2R45_03276 [Verrucomicrobia subdivision 3 bacterium]|nr:hypothetical protein [Limisphaerales bacterium]MCS1416136.1 hypothetical protein [Limisphaerales bacterium]
MVSGRILVIRGGAIGDFILTLPVLQAIKEAFPQAQLDVLGYPNATNLADLAGLADATRPIEAQALAGFFAQSGDLDADWAEYFSRFEIIISYLYDPDGIFRDNVGSCGQSHFIQGPHRPDESQDIHATEVFLKPLEKLAIFGANRQPKIPLSQSATDLSPGRPWLALHPGSGSPVKNWPIENWLELIQQLQTQTTWNLLIVGGEAERMEIERFKPHLDPSRFRSEICMPLTDLAILLAGCDGFVGHDSGISHLAAAVGLPGLVLWGQTKEAIWRPNSDQVVLINHKNGLHALPVDQIFARIPSPPSTSASTED